MSSSINETLIRDVVAQVLGTRIPMARQTPTGSIPTLDEWEKSRP